MKFNFFFQSEKWSRVLPLLSSNAGILGFKSHWIYNHGQSPLLSSVISLPLNLDFIFFNHFWAGPLGFSSFISTNPRDTNQGTSSFFGFFFVVFFSLLAGYCSLGCLSISEGTAKWKDQKAEGAAEGAARAGRDEKAPVTDDDNSRVSPAPRHERCSSRAGGGKQLLSKQTKQNGKKIDGEREKRKAKRLELSVSQNLCGGGAATFPGRSFRGRAPFPQSLSYSHSRISRFSLFQATTPLSKAIYNPQSPFSCCVPDNSSPGQSLLEASLHPSMDLPGFSQHWGFLWLYNNSFRNISHWSSSAA